MFFLNVVLLAALVGVWLAYPLLRRKPVATALERAAVAEDVEREIAELRGLPGANDENIPETTSVE